MNQQIAQQEDIISSLVVNGDISKLSPAQKVGYYKNMCERIGLDPLTQPFRILRLQGKEIMYCDRSGAQQLNKLYKVSHDVTAREIVSECYVVTARASMPDGRHTDSIGAVPIINLKGEALCNAMMKAETKAKRRATLDLLGLGILDETETQTIPNTEEVAIDLTATEEEMPLSVWSDEVNKCLDKAELNRLYMGNKATVDASPEIQAIFKQRQEQLKG